MSRISFQYAPYVKYEGEKGSSKSKACEVHEYIDFNAFSGVDYTPAVIFRTLQDTRGTLIIDEAETYDKLKNKSEYEQAREAIINVPDLLPVCQDHHIEHAPYFLEFRAVRPWDSLGDFPVKGLG